MTTAASGLLPVFFALPVGASYGPARWATARRKSGSASSDILAPLGDGRRPAMDSGEIFMKTNHVSRFFRRTVSRFDPGFPVRSVAIALLALAVGETARAQTILGSTGAYAVMAGSTVTINGVNTFNGNLGAANIAGDGSSAFTPTGASVGAMTALNQTDFTRAFTGLAAMTGAVDLTGQILGTGGGVTTLAPGIYKFTSTAQLTGTLTLDAQGRSNAVWVFQIGTTFDTAAGASVVFANLAANSVTTNGLFWKVGSTTSFGASTNFEGNVLSGTSFTVGAGARINHGRILTGTGQTITLAGNSINFDGANSGYSGGLAFLDAGNSISAIPEPSTYALWAGAAALGAVGFLRRSRRADLRV